jgi:hydroxyquinol 1,2-dioxygenase
MIIESEKDITPAVLSELARAKNPRFREIMSAFVRHLHEFAREVKLTEQEFQAAVGYMVALGKHTNETHNEAVLMSGSLGFSSLICLLNNGSRGQTETDANLLGPFWRMNSPKTQNGDSIVRSPTPGPGLFVDATFQDVNGKPIPGALVDIWQSSPEGFYENQDPIQADMNLRGQFTTDAEGHIGFRSVKPAGYPIPVDGPVGELLRAQGRHNMRPAHLHFLVYKPGFKTLISQLYDPEDKNLETDAQFGVTRHLIGNYVRHDEPHPGTSDVKAPWYSLEHTFVMENGEARLPRPPITGKAQGERPQIPHLERV